MLIGEDALHAKVHVQSNLFVIYEISNKTSIYMCDYICVQIG